MNDTETKLVAWNGETYSGLGKIYDTLKSEEFSELTEHLDPDELLRVALFAWNTRHTLALEDTPAIIEEEAEAYQGEHNNPADFTRELLEETCTIPADFPDWVVIDYQTTWEASLRHDFFSYEVIDTDGDFRRFYWRAF
jgi:hypothetical protein